MICVSQKREKNKGHFSLSFGVGGGYDPGDSSIIKTGVVVVPFRSRKSSFGYLLHRGPTHPFTI